MKPSIYNHIVEISGVVIVYNTFVNKYMAIDNQLLDCLTRCGNGESFDENSVKKLLLGGYVVDDEVDELNLVKNLFLIKRFSLKAYHIIVNTSLDCNLKCWYCYETHVDKSYMKQDIVDKILSHISLKYSTDHFEKLNLSLFGGEPLLNFKAIESLLQGVKQISLEKGFAVRLSVVTNCTCVSERYIPLFELFHTSFQITIDGDKNSHDKIRAFKRKTESSYDVILKNLKLLSERLDDYQISIRINYDNQILDKITQLIENLSFLDRKKSSISLQKVWQCNQDNIEKARLFDVINFINDQGFSIEMDNFSLFYSHCYADNYNEAVINYDGTIYKCTARDFDTIEPEGILKSEGIIEWNVDKLMERLMLKIPEMCLACSLLPCCPGICSQKLLEISKGKLACPFETRMSKNDLILYNIKQQIIRKRNERS